MSDIKPIIVFTTFWDADFIISNGGFYCKELDSFISFRQEEVEPLSVALGIPDLKKFKNFKEIKKIPCLTPKFSMLRAYKENGDWKSYTIKFSELIKENKKQILSFLNSLQNNKVYILCCWENTKNGAHCHRKIIYDALTFSKKTNDLANYFYRHGSKEEEDLVVQCISDKSEAKLENKNVSSDQPLNLSIGGSTLFSPLILPLLSGLNNAQPVLDAFDFSQEDVLNAFSFTNHEQSQELRMFLSFFPLEDSQNINPLRDIPISGFTRSENYTYRVTINVINVDYVIDIFSSLDDFAVELTCVDRNIPVSIIEISTLIDNEFMVTFELVLRPLAFDLSI